MYNICLVEDEKDLNHLIKTYLERENYNVTTYLWRRSFKKYR